MKSTRTRIEALEQSTGIAGGDQLAGLLTRYGRPAPLTAAEEAAIEATSGERGGPGWLNGLLQRGWVDDRWPHGLLQEADHLAFWVEVAEIAGRDLADMYREHWVWKASLPRQGTREAIDFVWRMPFLWEVIDPALYGCPTDPWAYHRRPELAQLTEQERGAWYAGLLAGGEYREAAVNFALEQWERFKAWWFDNGGMEYALPGPLELDEQQRRFRREHIAVYREQARQPRPNLWDEQGNYIADLAQQAPPVGGGEVAHDDGNGDKATAQEL